MIDTHCHIYVPQLEPDRGEVLQRAVSAGITDIVMPAIDFDSLTQMDALSHPEIKFHQMAGLHPCDVGQDISWLEQRLYVEAEKETCVGIGETGLDYYWSTDFVSQQKDSLRLHCAVSRDTSKPIVLHNRESTGDLLDIIAEEQDGRLTGVWHCFTGTEDEARRAIDMNLRLGIGGVITFKNAGVDLVVARLPLSEMVLETDAPYLTPAPHRGKRNEPAYMRLTAIKLASLKEIPLDEVIDITRKNAISLFKLR